MVGSINVNIFQKCTSLIQSEREPFVGVYEGYYWLDFMVWPALDHTGPATHDLKQILHPWSN